MSVNQITGTFNFEEVHLSIKKVHVYLLAEKMAAILQLRRRCNRRRRCACEPSSITATHDKHAKVNLWVSYSFLYECGAPLGIQPTLK